MSTNELESFSGFGVKTAQSFGKIAFTVIQSQVDHQVIQNSHKMTRLTYRKAGGVLTQSDIPTVM